MNDLPQGTKVKVLCCTTGHCFEVGQIVTREYGDYDFEYGNSSAFVDDSGEKWYMHTEEYEIVSYPTGSPENRVKELETVPKWKFDCLVKELEFYQNKLADSNHLHNKIKMFVDKDVWFWENDGDNHLESLVCPIVIDADVLRSLIKNGG